MDEYSKADGAPDGGSLTINRLRVTGQGAPGAEAPADAASTIRTPSYRDLKGDRQRAASDDAGKTVIAPTVGGVSKAMGRQSDPSLAQTVRSLSVRRSGDKRKSRGKKAPSGPEEDHPVPDATDDAAAEAEPKRPRGPAWLLVSSARGMSFFLGAYATLSLLASLRQLGYNPNIWWVTLSWLPSPVSWALQAALAVTLLAFAFRPPRGRPARAMSSLACAVFAALALRDAHTVLVAADAGHVRLGFAVPFSTFIMLAFLALAVAVFAGHRVYPEGQSRSRRLGTLLVGVMALAVCGVAFPLGQLFCFGLTDYRADADAAVILGAKVYPSGMLSGSLVSRVDKGVELYHQGYAPILIMSGGTGVEGVNEAEAMRRYAIDRGVPAEAILVDREGNNSELTVLHTIEIAEEHGFGRIIAVSSPYHLPRLKMLFLSNGHDVLTVPTDGVKEGRSLYTAAVREIPGWWYYWFKFVFGV